ncbi:hypothetical protein BKA70DRAFT_1427573 [Coprinopsis sp. MPI-PUGE-AT-0042]|nr:hypothetical protein BKA70DRAFT_1427573 [Coprinopsis sp. MPI-PUGE-AT-0042]
MSMVSNIGRIVVHCGPSQCFHSQPHLPCLSLPPSRIPTSATNDHPMPFSGFIRLIKQSAPPSSQAITLHDRIAWLRLVDRIKTLDLFTSKDLAVVLSFAQGLDGSLQLLPVEIRQRNYWRLDWGGGSVEIQKLPILTLVSSQKTQQASSKLTPARVPNGFGLVHTVITTIIILLLVGLNDFGAGRADLHLQDLVPLRQENNAGRELKQSRLCGSPARYGTVDDRRVDRILIRTSDYNELDYNAINLFDQDTVPPCFALPDSLTRLWSLLALNNQILDVLAQIYLPPPLTTRALEMPSLHWTIRTEAHEPPEYLGLTQDILWVVINALHNLLVFITACILGSH